MSKEYKAVRCEGCGRCMVRQFSIEQGGRPGSEVYECSYFCCENYGRRVLVNEKGRKIAIVL